MKLERERLQQGALEGLPTQVNLAAVSVSTSQEPSSEEEESPQEEGEHRKRASATSDSEADSPASKRGHFETDPGGISKLVEFCSKDIK